MTIATIKDLFASDISRNIEEVIKVDQDGRADRSRRARRVRRDGLDPRRTSARFSTGTPRRRTSRTKASACGSLASSAQESRASPSISALRLRIGHCSEMEPADSLPSGSETTKSRCLLKNIEEHIPTHAVIFDVSTDRGIRSGNQTITEIMYRLFLQSLGYAHDLDLSELEITLEEDGRLDEFKAKYDEVFSKDWDAEKGKVALAMQQASRVMHELEPETFTTVDSWRESVKDRADITAESARRALPSS